MSDRITTAYLNSGTQVGPDLRPLDEKLGPLARTIQRIRLGDQDFRVEVYTKEETPVAINLFAKDEASRLTNEEYEQAILERSLLTILRAMMAPPGLHSNIYNLSLVIEDLVAKYLASLFEEEAQMDAEYKQKALDAVEELKAYAMDDGPIYQWALEIEKMIKGDNARA